MTKNWLTFGLAVGLAFGSNAARAESYTATASTIGAIYRSAIGGDRITLVGTFGTTSFSNAHGGIGSIYIDARRAVFTDSVTVTNVNGLTINGGRYGSTGAPTRLGRGIVVSGGSDILIRSAAFVGNANASDNRGIEFIGTLRPTIYGSTFTDLYTGASFTGVQNGTMYKNAVTRAGADGFRIVDSHTVLFDRNRCTGGTPVPGAHPDCLQMWSILGNPVQSDVTVSNNYAYGPTQGFTSFDPDRGGALRARIINNRVDTSYSQGIACYGCVDSVITGNTVTTLPGATNWTTINVIGGSNNIVASNSIGPRPVSPNLAQARSTSASFAAVDSIAAVPEPATWAMLLAGFALVGVVLRRRGGLMAA